MPVPKSREALVSWCRGNNTLVINNITHERYHSKINMSSKRFLDNITKENPEFFEGYSLGDFTFMEE